MRRLLVFVAAVGVTFTPAVAAQARPSATLAGNDISFPQCGKTYPSGQAFAIVGVNGGKASNLNPCFSDEWKWAKTSTGGTRQAPAQLYVNTGNPGDVLAQYNVTDWPTSSDPRIDPHGTCSGTWTDDLACSWEYGYERAVADIDSVRAADPNFVGAAGGKWWLDIETANSWTSDTRKNQASLEGMVYALNQISATVGIYSSNGAWASLFGPVAASSPLYPLNEWRPGARTLSQAVSNCSLAPFEGNGRVEITQYVTTHLDYDQSCV